MAMIRARLDDVGLSFVELNQREFADVTLDFQIEGVEVNGRLNFGDRSYALEEFSGVYIRLADESVPLELDGEDPATSGVRYLRSLYETLLSWCQVTPARVVTRPSAAASNVSKPYQAQLIRTHGFGVPETLVTNDPQLVLEFYRRHDRVVYKSISSTRSVVRMLRDEDLRRIDSILWCPTQFQAFVEGLNVRVHTVAGQCFATAIRTDSIDYRYPHHHGAATVQMSGIGLPNELAERCLGLSDALNLPFAGIDLIIEPSGRAVCLEVNPSPAFSFYEAETEQPISHALALYLAGLF